MTRCRICGDEGIYIVGKGMVHKSTGTLYIQRCDKCGWKGGAREDWKCPVCGAELRDDHCFQPIWD